MELARVVEIDWEGGYGSGYFVAPGVVLTARHVLAGAHESWPAKGRKYRVRALGESPQQQRPAWDIAELVWTGDARTDVAVLHTSRRDPGQKLPQAGRLRPGMVEQIACKTVGFPLATAQKTKVDETYHLVAKINTGSRVEAGDLWLDVSSQPPMRPESWPGLSGAALFAGGVLVGIVRGYPREFGGRVLYATPIATVADDPAFCAALGQICPLPLEVLCPEVDVAEQRKSRRPLLYDLPTQLPQNYQEPTGALHQIKNQLIDDGRDVGVRGMAGVGKTVLATATILDAEIETAFPSGIVWLKIGRQADIRQKQAELAKALTGEQHNFQSWEEGRGRLSQLTQSEHLLVVLDDVWQVDGENAFRQIDAFKRLGTDCRLLVTTRDQAVVDRMGGLDYELKELSPKAALAMLAEATGTALADLGAEAADVATECGYLPLALASAAALVASDDFTWEELLEALVQADVESLEAVLRDYDHKGVLEALTISVDALSESDRMAFLYCGIFPENVQIPEDVLFRLWSEAFGANQRSHRRTVNRLVKLTLLRREEVSDTGAKAPGRRYSLHDLYSDYLQHAAKPLEPRHKALLRAYKLDCPNGWASFPDNDVYFFDRIGYHLMEAKEEQQLKLLATDPMWFVAKRRALGHQMPFLQDLDRVIQLCMAEPQVDLVIVAKCCSICSKLMTTAPPELISLVATLGQFDRAELMADNITFAADRCRAYCQLVLAFSGHGERDRAISALMEAQRCVEAIGPTHRSMAHCWIAEAAIDLEDLQCAQLSADLSLDFALRLEHESDPWSFPNGLFWAAKTLHIVNDKQGLARIRERISSHESEVGRNQWLQAAAVSGATDILERVAKSALPTVLDGLTIIRPGNLALALAEAGITDLRNELFNRMEHAEPGAAGEPDAQKRYAWALAKAGRFNRALDCVDRFALPNEHAEQPTDAIQMLRRIELERKDNAFVEQAKALRCVVTAMLESAPENALMARALELTEKLEQSADWRVLSYLAPTFLVLGKTERAIDMAERVFRLGIAPSEQNTLTFPPREPDTVRMAGLVAKVGRRVMEVDTAALEDEKAVEICEALASAGDKAAAKLEMVRIKIPKFRAMALRALALHDEDADSAFALWCESLLQARFVSQDFLTESLQAGEPILARVAHSTPVTKIQEALNELDKQWRILI